jgi:hypothetical protein
MAMGIRVSIDSRNLKRRMNAIQRKLDKNGTLAVRDIARWGRDQIILEMPRDTGESAKSIVAIERVNTKGYHEAVITRRGQPHPTKEYDGQWFNLPRWILVDGNYKTVWRGSPSIAKLEKAREVPSKLQKEFKRRVINDVKNSIG